MRYLILLLVSFWCVVAYSQQSVSDIKVQLDSLSDQVPGLNEPVDFTLVDAPLYELLRGVAETHNLNVSLNNLPQINITNNFTNVMVKDLLVFLCQEYGIRIRFTNNIFSFYLYRAPVDRAPLVELDSAGDRISFNVNGDPLRILIREFTEKTGINLIANQGVETQQINAYIKSLPVESALQNLADINNLELIKKEEGVYQLINNLQIESQNSSRRSTMGNINTDYKLQTFYIDGERFVSLNCFKIPIADLIRSICDQLNVNYLFLIEPQGSMNCRLDSVRFEDFLNIALETARLSYSISDPEIYVIGEQQNQGLNEARIYSFKNRSVEGIDEIIPAILTQQAQIKIFNDLNALIITGSERATEKLVDFLADIDKAVPNVLIEVIVAEIRKGSSVRTGVEAFLSDSVPATSGQIFGGVDVTLSSGSINKLLNNLDSRGIVNLGRVTPQFYATIQAMEENNNLNIRSTPKLSTLNGHEATMTIGQSVYYLIETQNVTGGINPIVTVTPRYEKVEANLDLKISPFVSDQEDVTLTIEAEFSDFISPDVKGAPPGNATRKFISKIRVKNEEMVVMGGLEEVSKSDIGSGVPLLSRIPIIKWLFSSRSKESTDSKLLIFVKPTIVY